MWQAMGTQTVIHHIATTLPEITTKQVSVIINVRTLDKAQVPIVLGTVQKHNKGDSLCPREFTIQGPHSAMACVHV